MTDGKDFDDIPPPDRDPWFLSDTWSHDHPVITWLIVAVVAVLVCWITWKDW